MGGDQTLMLKSMVSECAFRFRLVSHSSTIWMFPKIVGFPPKSSILIGFSIINHPFWGTPILGNTHIMASKLRNISPWCNHPHFHPAPWHWKVVMDLKVHHGDQPGPDRG